mmetsp:Transcript_14592/g.35168  ORF Transcript_14592/g.35168 Transcript_14592/m.35168 type:complete len:266 (-) Transcript_14592:828-1625(-)
MVHNATLPETSVAAVSIPFLGRRSRPRRCRSTNRPSSLLQRHATDRSQRLPLRLRHEGTAQQQNRAEPRGTAHGPTHQPDAPRRSRSFRILRRRSVIAIRIPRLAVRGGRADDERQRVRRSEADFAVRHRSIAEYCGTVRSVRRADACSAIGIGGQHGRVVLARPSSRGRVHEILRGSRAPSELHGQGRRVLGGARPARRFVQRPAPAILRGQVRRLGPRPVLSEIGLRERDIGGEGWRREGAAVRCERRTVSPGRSGELHGRER